MNGINGELNGSVRDSGEESTADDIVGLYKVIQLLDTQCLCKLLAFQDQTFGGTPIYNTPMIYLVQLV